MTNEDIVPTLGHPAINPAMPETESALANPSETNPAARSTVPTPTNGYGHNMTYEFRLDVQLRTGGLQLGQNAQPGVGTSMSHRGAH